ncbi:MAG: cell division protein FtsQ/DivIB [Bdellovibrionota bacterium]
MNRVLIVAFLLVFSQITDSLAEKKSSKPIQGPSKKASVKKTDKKSKAVATKKKSETPKAKSPEKKKEDTGPKVKKFEFIGIKRTSQDELRKISAKYIHSPLYGEWTESMIKDIQSIPIVREAHLMRDMTGNITFKLIEKEPIAYLYLDQYYWMDERAHVIQSIPSDQLENKIFFSGPWKNLKDYEKKNGPVVLMEGIRFYSTLLTKKFPEKEISEIHFDANSGWIMYRVGSRAPVVFGIADLPEKVERFVTVVPQLTAIETSISRIDADFNDRVVIKLLPTPDGNRS